MIKIGICDEDKTFTNKLYDTICTILFPIDEWTTKIFHNGDEIIHAIKTNEYDCQLLFMDIMIKDGLEAIRYMLENEINTDIIFIRHLPICSNRYPKTIFLPNCKDI